MNRLLTPVIALLFAIAGCSSDNADDEIKTTRAGSFNDDSVTTAINLGWLPRNIPLSATNIVETHNIDTNEFWVRFDFHPDDLPKVIEGCVSESRLTLPDLQRTKRWASWWLQGLHDRESNATDTLVLYACPNAKFGGSQIEASVAIDSKIGRAWYWRTN